MHTDFEPSRWITRFAPLVRPGAAILDLACGGGRHTRWFHARGHPVTAVDRDLSGLEDLRGQPELELVEADLEGAPWPLPGRRFGAVIVTNYLWRPLFPAILDSVDENGVLLYDTFARGNEAYGKPSNPDFLLEPGELIEAGARPAADRRLRARPRSSGRSQRSGSACAPCAVTDLWRSARAPDAEAARAGLSLCQVFAVKRPPHQKARCAAGFPRV